MTMTSTSAALRRVACGVSFVFVITASSAFADDEKQRAKPLPAESTISSAAGNVTARVVARGLVHPWAVALKPDGALLVTERDDGRLRVVRDGADSDPVAGVPEVFRFKGATDRSQAGLFDVRLHPDFAENRLIYLSLAAPTDRGASVRIVRGRLAEGASPKLENVQTIFDMQQDDQDSSGLHLGGRMAIDAQKRALLLTIGDRRNISRAQSGDDQAGSVLRMTLDGEPMKDNPFIDNAERNDFIFAMGARNPQAITLHPQTGEVWTVDHGPKGGDRLDRVESGANLGWPHVTGGVDYSGAPLGHGLNAPDGMKKPLHVFKETVAPSGAAFHRGDMFSEWNGSLLIGGLANRAVMRVSLKGDNVDEVEKIDIGRRVRDVEVGPDGAVWLVTDHEDGELVRLTPK
jgi:aldose sugar dehydrogenase